MSDPLPSPSGTGAPEDVSREKARLRVLAIGRRAALDAETRQRFSDAATAAIRPLLLTGETVALFWPIRDEIDPRGLLAPILDGGGTVALPTIHAGRLTFHPFEGADGLRPGPLGLRQPAPDAPVIDPGLIVVPLAAFDGKGGRIGYGKGYYDGAIGRMHARGLRPRLVGIAFSVQEVDAVPMEAHDVPLPLIATEKGLRRLA